MIIKNLTFVVPVKHERAFHALAFQATELLKHRVEGIRLYKLIERLDPETYNFAIQLSFQDIKQLEAYNREALEEMIEQIQAGIPEQILYFESHLEKIF